MTRTIARTFGPTTGPGIPLGPLATPGFVATTPELHRREVRP